MISYLEFEKPVAQLEARIAELRSAAEGDDVDIAKELERLEVKSADLLASTYSSLTPWQKTQVARHPARPHQSPGRLPDATANRWIAFRGRTVRSPVVPRALVAAKL